MGTRQVSPEKDLMVLEVMLFLSARRSCKESNRRVELQRINSKEEAERLVFCQQSLLSDLIVVVILP